MAPKNTLTYLLFIVLFNWSLGVYAQTPKDYSLLWRIEGNGLEQPSYLFGTMHVKDARAFNFSDSVLLALDRCNYFALEQQPDSMMNEIFNKYFEENQSFRQLFSEEEYNKINERLKKEKGYDLDKMNLTNPKQIRFLLSSSVDKPDDRQTFVDAYLYGIAKTIHKKVFGLEDVKDQTDIFFGASRAEQRKEILEVLESDSESYRQGLEKMIDIYSRGNIKEIQSLMNIYGLVDSIMIRRNQVMTSRLDKLMKKSSTFAAVGCAHLPGENGIIDMLRKKGYTVKRVEASFTGVANEYKIDPLKMEWHAYRDENFGFELKTPGKLIPADIIPGVNLMIYPDLATEAAFFMMTLDLRGSSQPVNEEEMIEKMVKNYQSSDKFESLKKKNILKNGISAKEVKGKNGEIFTTIHLMIHNNILYCQFATHKQTPSDQAYVDKFFNSFQTFSPLPQKENEWNVYHNKAGAFNVLLPFPPKETQQIYTDVEEFEIQLFQSADIPNMTNYILGYNDYPLGYFLENKNEIFKAMEEEYKGKGNLLLNQDTIWLNGYEGREYEVMLAEKYYTISRVYVRGNRVYKVIQQNLNEGERKLQQGDFLSSFSFTPFESPELKNLKPENVHFSLEAFPDYRITIDSAIEHSSYLGHSTTYTFKDPKSGGVYLLEYSKVKDYFMISHADTFYTNIFHNNILGWSDSLVSSKTVDLGGIPGREMISLNKFNQQQKRHRMWLDDQKFFYMTAFVAEEALFSEASNTFFQSYKRRDSENSFDIYASKSAKIMEDLKSDEPFTYNAALGALDYYEFTEADMPLVQQALSTTFPDDSLETGVRSKLIKQLPEMDFPAIPQLLENLYTEEKTTDAIKSSILLTAIDMEDEAGMELYLKLFTQEPPSLLDSHGWAIFQPFSDSLELAAQHYHKLLSMMDKEDYKYNVLSLASAMVNSDSTKKALVSSSYNLLTKFALKDLESYLSTIDTADEGSFYNPEIYQYLNLATNIKDKAFTDTFTSQFLASNITGWMRTLAVAARVFNGLENDKKEVSELLASLESRYVLMSAFNKANKLYEVPKKYRKQEEFARLCLYETLSSEEGIPDEIKLLGHIMHEGSRVYAFSFSYDYDKESNYLGLSGFYSPDGKTLNFSKTLSYSPWEILKKDWKKQAQQYTTDLKEYGY